MNCHDVSRRLAWLSAAAAVACLPSAALHAAPAFRWTSTDPVVTPKSDATHDSVAVKDPTVVYANGKYHLFMTTAGKGGWHMAYTSFADWSDAPNAPITYLDQSPIGPGYRAAPQVFYFAPQRLWYLIYQGGDPLYSTTANIDDPMSWSAPKPFFDKMPEAMKASIGKGFWLDFWIICDERKCHLFNTSDAGHLFRSETTLDQFPKGFGNTALVLHDPNPNRLFEASMTYKVRGTGTYLTLIEAIAPDGRYYRSWTSDRLDGTWRPLADTVEKPFAGPANVSFPGGRWSQDISHGELIRDNDDQTPSIDPCQPLRFLYQGRDPSSDGMDYIQLPYRLGLLTAVGDNPISRLCKEKAR